MAWKKDPHLLFLFSVVILLPVATGQLTGGQEGKDVKGESRNAGVERVSSDGACQGPVVMSCPTGLALSAGAARHVWCSYDSLLKILVCLPGPPSLSSPSCMSVFVV